MIDRLLAQKQAVIFDLDGTLVDSMWMWRAIDIEYLGRFGLACPPGLSKAIEGMSFTETACYFQEHFQLPLTVEAIKADWTAMSIEKYRTQVPLKKGARAFLAYIKRLGLPMGIALVLTAKDGLRPHPIIYKVLDFVANIVRSVPFIILLIMLMPVTKWIVGKSYGPTATIVPLTIAAAPFIARLVESSLLEVDRGVIEAAQSMGAGTWHIVWKVLLAEARVSLIVNATIALATILGYSAMSGAVGGGGLGDVAIRYGYHRYQVGMMMITVVLLVLLVQIMQYTGTAISKVMDKRNR